MSKEQFKRLKTIALKVVPRVKFEDRTKLSPEQRKAEVEVGEALSRTGLIFDSADEVKKENLRSEGLSE